MRYLLFRISLAEREIPGLLAEMSSSPQEKPSRGEFIGQVFGQNIEFAHRKIPFAYVFVGRTDEFLFGRIGRQVRETTSAGPEEKLAERQEHIWHAANIIVSTKTTEDGQKLAFQRLSMMGQPAAICESLAIHINNTTVDRGWLMNIHAITESKDFWKVAHASKGEITDLELNFVAPNIFGGRDATRNALRRFRDLNRMQSLTTKLTNKEGALDPDSKDIRQGVEYISEGGGSVKLKSGKKTLYDSETHSISKDVPDDDDFAVNESNRSFWRFLVQRLFGQ